jgi:hypothetical protein
VGACQLLNKFSYNIYIFLNQLQGPRPLLALVWLRHYIHSIHIFVQQSFKSMIEFVGPNVGPIIPMVDLKMRCVRYIIYIYIISRFVEISILTSSCWDLSGGVNQLLNKFSYNIYKSLLLLALTWLRHWV